MIVRREKMVDSGLYFRKCGFCKEEHDEDEFQECLECGEKVCNNCIDVGLYGDPICPGCLVWDDDELY
jgi:hypothetical protein